MTLKLPGAGVVPTHNINIQELLRQGTPSLGEQFANLDTLFPKQTVTAGTVAPIQAPSFPEFDPLPPFPL